MKKSEKFYITTPIYFPSGAWHLGTCYTTVMCDCIARFKRKWGYDVFFLTGTDEHGQKIETNAKKSGMTPIEYVNGKVAKLKELWKLLGVSYDKFIRTTDNEHIDAVQKIFARLYEKGDIYLGEYSGHYCVPCESFWTEAQLKDGKCPDCGREVKLTKEESYFFRLSKYRDKVMKFLEENPDFLEPKSRVNEMLNNFLKPGLSDLCVSRTTVKWGIPVPFDNRHVVYVWMDALNNYITALGCESDDRSEFDRYWPADLHMMGKEIVRFHAVIWPAFLMALDLPLPKKIYAHGWMTFSGDKISKSKGNTVDPVTLSERYGADAVRYYLLRAIPFGQDGNYTNAVFLNRINADLANDLGNLVSRTAAMIERYAGGVLPGAGEYAAADRELIERAEGLLTRITEHIDRLSAPDALGEIIGLAQSCNKYIDETAPWTLDKNGDGERLNTVLYVLAETIRIIAVATEPFLPETSGKILESLSSKHRTDFGSIKKFGGIKAGVTVNKIPPLFPRIDIEKELKFLNGEISDTDKPNGNEAEDGKKKALQTIERTARNGAEKSLESADCGVEKRDIETKNKSAGNAGGEVGSGAHETRNDGLISIDEFAKIKLKTAKITACERVEKSDKLLKFTLKCGEETRTVVSGIAHKFAPDETVGKTVVIVANLRPAKLRGVLSEGMILCAEDAEHNLAIVTTDGDFADGCTVR
ncbi:MAG: methionine--tRNA ligase [Clostridiales bacterium]|jgi:methionyl-tRNA synthetase|nr:methionine--tRNA ligase [Clostridiales bacterium]